MVVWWSGEEFSNLDAGWWAGVCTQSINVRFMGIFSFLLKMDQAYPWEEIIIWKCVFLKSCTTTSRFYGISWQHGKTQHIHTRNTTEAIFTKKFCCKLSEWIPFTLPACEVSLLCCASKSDQKKPQRGLSLVLARHNLRYYPLVRFEFMYTCRMQNVS